MYKLIALFAVLAVAAAQPFLLGAGGLGAPLLPKVSYEPAEVKTVKQEYTVQQPEYTYRNVPVPVPVAQPYSVPYAVPYPVAHAYAPVAHPAVPAYGYSALPYGAYGAGYPVLTTYKGE